MMTDYQVVVEAALDRPLTEAEVELFFDALNDEDVAAAISVDSLLSATMTITAAKIGVALADGLAVFAKAAKEAGTPVGEVLGTEALEAGLADRRLAESNMPDIVSAPEVGRILNVSRQRVHQLLAENASFPAPLLRLGAGPIWLRSTIEVWDAQRVKRAGRPRTRPSTPLSA